MTAAQAAVEVERLMADYGVSVTLSGGSAVKLLREEDQGVTERLLGESAVGGDVSGDLAVFYAAPTDYADLGTSETFTLRGATWWVRRVREGEAGGVLVWLVVIAERVAA